MALHDWIPQQPGSSGPQAVEGPAAGYPGRTSRSCNPPPPKCFPSVPRTPQYLTKTSCKSRYQRLSAAGAGHGSQAAPTLSNKCPDLQA